MEASDHNILLMHLSTELLLLVLEKLSPPALLAVSRTSRQFHYLALPVYFSRYNISHADLEERRLVLEGDMKRALPGLRASISLTSLDKLSCLFSGENSEFTWEAHYLTRLISKLSNINCVTLDLRNIDSRWIDGLALINTRAWKEKFLRLLTLVVEKGCSHLIFTYGHFLPTDPLDILENIQKPRRSFRGSVLSVAAFLKPPSPTKEKEGHFLHTNRLKNISIHSSLFFIDPFYEWFIQMTAVSPIHTLSFRISGVPRDAWTTTLSRISIQSLSRFSAESIDISFVDLMKFLSRHASIETLDLHPNFVYAGQRKLGKRAVRPYLPILRTVSGSPENMRDLLDALRPPLPRLRAIKLSLPTHQSIFRAVDFRKLEQKISESIQGVMPTELSLKFLVPYLVDDQSRGKKNDSAQGKTTSYFPSVQWLEFTSDGNFAFAKWIIPKLPQWLATFPVLQCVVFSGGCIPPDIRSNSALVESIRLTCTGVTSVVIGEERFPVTH